MKTFIKLTCIAVITVLLVNSAFAQKQKQNSKNKNQKGNPTKILTYDELVKTAQPVTEQKQNGVVNWTEQFIEAKGESVIDTVRFKNKAQARAMATRGAVVVAQRNLLEIINGVRITGETTVEDMITKSDYIYSKVDGVIKGAEMVGNPKEEYGLIVVTLKVKIYEQNGLAPVVYDNLENNTNDNTNNNTNNNNNNNADNIVDTANAEKPFMFNFNGKQFDPALFPVVVDENDNVLLDLTKVYDPTKGKFPKYLKQSKNILKELGLNKAVDIIDVIDAKDGKIKVNTIASKKVDWKKIGNTLGKIGKVLLMLI